MCWAWSCGSPALAMSKTKACGCSGVDTNSATETQKSDATVIGIAAIGCQYYTYYILSLQNMCKRSRLETYESRPVNLWMKFQSTSVRLLSWTSWELDKSTKLWSFCIPYGSALSVYLQSLVLLCVLCHGCHHARSIQQSKQFRIVSKSVESSCKASSSFWGEKSLICDVTMWQQLVQTTRWIQWFKWFTCDEYSINDFSVCSCYV